MQPRFVDGRWVAVTKENGFWGEKVAVDVAPDPWGPWTTVQQVVTDDDPILNTYGALAVPWLTPDGSLIVSLSRNARDMRRDAYPVPGRYRPTFLTMALPSAAAAAAASAADHSAPEPVVIPEQRENRR